MCTYVRWQELYRSDKIAHTPLYFHNFCSRLKQRNVNVLGIIDTDYQNISQETKNSLTDCYCVNSLDNYDEVYRAVAYFISKYGRIDFIESQNEYWLETEAKLRDDFNILHGTRFNDLSWMKYKSKMKQVFLKAVLKYFVPLHLRLKIFYYPSLLHLLKRIQ